MLLGGVPWSAYVVLRDSIESASVRMTYLDGALEIMSPSSKHEVDQARRASAGSSPTSATAAAGTLRGDHYEKLAVSDVFPEVPLERIAHYLTWADQPAALRAFRDELRGGRAPSAPPVAAECEPQRSSERPARAAPRACW